MSSSATTSAGSAMAIVSTPSSRLSGTSWWRSASRAGTRSTASGWGLQAGQVDELQPELARQGVRDLHLVDHAEPDQRLADPLARCRDRQRLVELVLGHDARVDEQLAEAPSALRPGTEVRLGGRLVALVACHTPLRRRPGGGG
jgi:hypothetical protein